MTSRSAPPERSAGCGPERSTGNVYPKYETRHRLERAMMSGFLRHLDRALTPLSLGPTGGTILDLGAGEGEIAARTGCRFPGATLVAVDLPDPALARLWQGRGWSAVFADAGRLPFPDRAADLVLALEVLEHLPDPAAALAEIARVARGPVVLSVPLEPLWRVGNVLRRRYLSSWGNTPGHLQHWGRRGFTALVGRHLEVVDAFTPLPWTMVVARAP
jgi:ubiquinone/menaquinone biosynthesis C-methylase UbiE